MNKIIGSLSTVDPEKLTERDLEILLGKTLDEAFTGKKTSRR